MTTRALNLVPTPPSPEASLRVLIHELDEQERGVAATKAAIRVQLDLYRAKHGLMMLPRLETLRQVLLP